MNKSDSEITKSLSEKQSATGVKELKDLRSAIESMSKAPDDLVLALPPHVVGKLLYLLNHINKNDRLLLKKDKELAKKRISVALRLLSTLDTRKGYLVALESYQPLLEYEKIKAEDAVDALWHCKKSIFNINSRRVHGAYNYMNSEQMKVLRKSEVRPFSKHEYVKYIPADYRLLRGSKAIVKDLRETDSNSILRKLSDMDASVLCELVYEEAFFNAAASKKVGSSIADLLYLSPTEFKADGLSVDKDFINYYDYYYPILDKYKLVATSVEFDVSSTFSDISYFAIVVADKNDDENCGLYIINRGTDQPYDFYDDFKMGAGKMIPSPKIVPHMVQGINFANKVLDMYEPLSIGFSGHSLGGAIAQIQTVKLVTNGQASVAPTVCFEPFGTKSEVDPSVSIHIGDTYFTTTTDIWTSFKNWSNVLSAGYFFKDWHSLEVDLIINYRDHGQAIYSNIKNFARRGDPIAELSEQIGNTIPLMTGIENSYYDYINQSMKGIIAVPTLLFEPLKRFNLHRMMWYRYNQYSNDGTLIRGGLNDKNMAILLRSGDEELKRNFYAVFDIHEV
ncbi:hypothetical protein IBE48_04935 [Francisella philomiragia]|uniref:Lipase family protein n=1 Tax=Francisella philomiragia TaxID=28110 RepID=A0AAW3DBV5_9GAMM|nr:hypothetical protein [Francisella philomiragia]KFJ42870.1 lipase family protein [Francisella philomiragia]MBK2254010.1 hypothetical protein [Francisella philomiragia]MBK2272322.1 hypothetical protein [Francisella philomiragia]MBK2276164.1 hypothetical protein [Francisella philomiragia]MBK2280111.1 hypothetical protein [Francisella philomiragia]